MPVNHPDNLRVAVMIPARYGSSRFPGKPLALIAGKPMLTRVVELVRAAIAGMPHARLYITTEDERIASHAKTLDVPCLMTEERCPSGTDRVAEAMAQLPEMPDFVLNMQGDAPLTPPTLIAALIRSYADSPCDMVTPVTRLSWAELDELREAKQQTPHSGTCAVFEQEGGRALWFSKAIIPAIRKEEAWRRAEKASPVYRHIGLYGYRPAALAAYTTLPQSRYEQLEGLEQLRALEAGFHIRCVPVAYDQRPSMSGIDSPEDVARAEALMAKYGEEGGA